MQKVALFYNPVAGIAGFAEKLDRIVYLCQEQGLQVVPFRIRNEEYIHRTMKEIAGEPWHTLIAAGGDGTLHQVVNAMIHNGIEIPLALFPEGTTNDVANYLHIPRDEESYCRMLSHGTILPLDVGQIGNRYFVNVASAGFITETAHEVAHNMKNLLGRMAYFLKGLEKIPKLRMLRMRIRDDSGTEYVEDNVFFFMILNGGVAGGFRHLPFADAMRDGYLDLLAIKKTHLYNIPQMLMKWQSGQLIDDEAIFYCRARSFDIDLQPNSATDLDGERGPQLPWHVKVCPQRLLFRLPEEEDMLPDWSF